MLTKIKRLVKICFFSFRVKKTSDYLNRLHARKDKIAIRLNRLHAIKEKISKKIEKQKNKRDRFIVREYNLKAEIKQEIISGLDEIMYPVLPDTQIASVVQLSDLKVRRFHIVDKSSFTPESFAPISTKPTVADRVISDDILKVQKQLDILQLEEGE